MTTSTAPRTINRDRLLRWLRTRPDGEALTLADLLWFAGQADLAARLEGMLNHLATCDRNAYLAEEARQLGSMIRR